MKSFIDTERVREKDAESKRLKKGHSGAVFSGSLSPSPGLVMLLVVLSVAVAMAVAVSLAQWCFV